VLPNGTVVDAATRAELEALRPQYESQLTVARTAQAKAIEAGQTVTEPPEVQAARELLVQKYGQDGLKYISTHRELVKDATLLSTRTVSDKANPSYIPAGEDGSFVYFFVPWINWTSWPWGSIEWLTPEMHGLNKVTTQTDTISIETFVARIVDQATPAPGVQNTATSSWNVSAYGHYYNGFCPPPAKPGTGYIDAYDSRLTNGHVSATVTF
jgi:hypothetical protein